MKATPVDMLTQTGEIEGGLCLDGELQETKGCN